MSIDRQAFDAERGNRTDEYLSGIQGFERYREAQLTLVAHPDAVRTYAGQLLVLIASSLILRWCRNVRLRVPDAQLTPGLERPGQSTLLERLGAEASQADPWADPFGSDLPAPYVIHLGGQVPGWPADLVVSSNGWVAYASRAAKRRLGPDMTKNPSGAALAGCIASAEALKVALGFPDMLRASEVTISLFDFSTDGALGPPPAMPDNIQLGRGLMVGAGSVGSNLAYLMSTMELVGEITVVDHDEVKIHNLDRSAMFGVADVGRKKADVVADWMSSNISTAARAISYNEYVRDVGRSENSLDILFPLANEQQVRWAIANSIPPIAIHGTTRPDWGANLGRHIPLTEPCLGCRFGKEPEPQLICATGDVTPPGVEQAERNDAALPFLSFAAATFALAELIKLQLPGYPMNRGFVDLDFKGPLQALAHHDRAYRDGCACTAVTPALFERFNGDTLFADLSLKSNARRLA